MGVDAKNIQVCAVRILKFFFNTTNRCIKKHPFVSGVFLFFFLLYIFVPFVFKILVFSSPCLVFFVVVLRIYWSSKQSQIQNDKKDEKRNNGGLLKDDLVVNRNDSSFFRSQRSRRRNVKQKNEELDAQVGKEEEAMVLQTVSKEDLIGTTAIEEKESYSIERGESSSANASEAVDILNVNQRHVVFDSELSKSDRISSDGGDEECHKYGGGGGELEPDNSEADYDDEEDGNKAVEWTEDDQKNLMDLGISEIERNKRLESLIAKRRAKKIKMKVEKDAMVDLDSVPQGQIAPIYVARNNTFDVPNLLDDIEPVHLPGSAPSTSKRNPFDLPYDPLEEKPNLMGDSFQEEFMAPQQKDMLFCRHESFGPFFPMEPKQDRLDKKFGPIFAVEKGALDASGYSRFRRPADIEDPGQLIGQIFSEEGNRVSHIDSTRNLVESGGQVPNQVINSVAIQDEEDRKTKNDMIDVKGEAIENSHGIESMLSNKSEVHMEPHLSEDSSDSSDESNSLSSDEENEQTFNANRAEVSENVESAVGNFMQKSLRCSIPKPRSEPLYDSSPSAYDKNRVDSSVYFSDKRSCHTPTNSIASDLQVEVSEIGSPPLTVDGTNSLTDGESLTYDEDFEKEITPGSEEMWGASSHLSRVEENESKSRGVHEVCQDDVLKVGFSGVDEHTLHIPPQQVDEQESSDTSSLSSSRIEISGESQAQSIDINHDTIHDDVKQVVEGVGEPMPSNSSDMLLPENLENAIHLMEKAMVHSPHEVYSEKAKESSYSQEMSTNEVDAVYDVDHSLVQAKADVEDLKTNEDTDGGWQIVIKQETVRDPSKLAQETNVESSKYREHYSEKPTEHQAILDSIKPIEENNNSKLIEDVGESLVKLTEDGRIMDMAKQIEAQDNLISIQESKDEQSIVSGVSGVNQNSEDPIAPAVQQPLVVEFVDPYQLNSSSSSSPKSVLAERIPTDQVSSSNSNQNIDIDVLQSHLEDIAKTNSLDEQTPLNLTPNAPQNAHELVEDSTAHASNNRDFKNLLEPSNLPEKSIEEATIIDNLKEPVVNDKEGQENSISYEAIIGQSEILINQEASTGQSKPAEELGKFAVEVNTIYNDIDPVISEKEDKQKFKSVEDSGGESQSLIKQEAILELPKPDELTISKLIEDTDEKSRTLTEDEALLVPPKSIEEIENSITKEETEESGQLNEANAVYNADHSIAQAKADVEELKTNEDTDGGWHLVIKQETVRDLSKLAQETNADSSKYIEHNPEKPTEHQAILDSIKPIEENKNSKFLEDVGGSLAKLTEDGGIMDMAKQIEVQDNLKSIQESKEEQSIVESEVSGVNQNSDDPIASAVQQDLVVEFDDQVSSSNPNKKIQIDFLPSHLEDIPITNSLEERTPLNLTPNATQDAQDLVEGSTFHASNNRAFKSFQEPSNLPEKSTEEATIIDNLKEPMVNDEDGQENSISYETIIGQSKTLMNQEASTGQSKPAEELGKFAAEVNTIYNVIDPVISEKEDKQKFKSVEDSGGESQSLIKQEAILELPKPDELTSSKLIEDIYEKSRTLIEGEALLVPSKSIEAIENSITKEETKESGQLDKANAVYDADHSIAQAKADVEELKTNEDTDAGWQLVVKQETMRYLSKLVQETDAESNKYIEHKKATKHQDILDSIKPIEENKNSKLLEDVGGSLVKLTEDRGIMDMAKQIEVQDNLKSIQEHKDEQSIVEGVVSGVNQNSDDPIASAVKQDLVVEFDDPYQLNSSSSSSSKYALAEKIPTGQVSPSNSNQKIHIDVLQSQFEDIAITNSLEELTPLNLNPNAPQDAQDLVEDSTVHASNDSAFKNFQEPGKFAAEANTIYNVNDPVISEKKDKEKLKSVEDSEGESQSLIKQEAILELPKPDELTSSKFIEDNDLVPSKSIEELEVSITKEETEESRQLNEQEAIFNMPKPADTAGNLEAIKAVGGESENWAEFKAADPSKPAT